MYSSTQFYNTVNENISLPYAYRNSEKKASEFVGKLRLVKTINEFYALYGQKLTTDAEMLKIMTYVFELAMEVGAIEKGLHPFCGSKYFYGRNGRIEFEDKTKGEFPNGNRYIQLNSAFNPSLHNGYINAKNMRSDGNPCLIKKELIRLTTL